MENSVSYVPGACNIDRKGVIRRRRMGYVVVVIGTALQVFMILNQFPPLFKYIEAMVISWAAIMLFRQAKNQFCVVNGLSGIEETSGTRREITEAVNRNRDISRVGKEFVITTILALIIGLVGFIPF